MKLLELLARACALLGGALLTGIALLTCASIVGRNTTGWTLVGDIEIVAFATAAAVALAMPWCQWRRGHIAVDFFTARARQATRDRLDRAGAALLALVLGLLAWRSAVGGLNAFRSHAGSMMLGVPEWWVYAALVPALALTAVVAAAQALHGLPARDGAAR